MKFFRCQAPELSNGSRSGEFRQRKDLGGRLLRFPPMEKTLERPASPGEAGLAKTFSLAERLTSGGVGDALLPIDVPTICHMGVVVHEYRAAIR